MAAFFLTLSGLIMITYSTTIICDKSICDFGICQGTECHYNIYKCLSSTNICSLQCDAGCLNITIDSSAQQTEILCTHDTSCHGLSIQISQNYTQMTHNSLLLSCAHSSSCAHIDIACIHSQSCECQDHDDSQCRNNVNGNYTIGESVTEAPDHPKKGNAVVLIVFMVIFWILVCLVVPICFIRRFRDNLLAKQTQPKPVDTPRSRGQSASDTKEHSKTHSKERIIYDHSKNAPTKAKAAAKDPSNPKRQRTVSTHRRALSSSMMARIKEHLNVDPENEKKEKETEVNSAEAMIPYIETKEDGELAIPAHIVAQLGAKPKKPAPIAANPNNHEMKSLNAEQPLMIKVSPSMDEGGDVQSFAEVSDSEHAENDKFSDGYD